MRCSEPRLAERVMRLEVWPGASCNAGDAWGKSNEPVVYGKLAGGGDGEAGGLGIDDDVGPGSHGEGGEFVGLG